MIIFAQRAPLKVEDSTSELFDNRILGRRSLRYPEEPDRKWREMARFGTHMQMRKTNPPVASLSPQTTMGCGIVRLHFFVTHIGLLHAISSSLWITRT